MKTTWLPGLADYGETLELQEQMVLSRQQGIELEDELLLLQHKPVYTIGRTRDRSSLNGAIHLPHPVFETNRGGQATYHGPGQLVGYPISDLNRMGRDLHLYIRGLEQTLVETCALFGVTAWIREGLVGIWVEDRKLGSIGVGVRKWISMHGFAVNITKDSLIPFLSITPCGLQNVKMTCLESEMLINGDNPPTGLLEQFGEQFSLLWEEHCRKQNIV